MPRPADSPPIYDAPSERAGPWWRVHRVEDTLLSLVLAAMVLLPVLEITLRSTLSVGVANAAALVQHGVLLVGMLGAAVAAREGRLLSIAGLGRWVPERFRWVHRAAAGGLAMAVTGVLARAAWDFVSVEREGGNLLAYGVPVWWVEAVMPAGFALIALRLWIRSGERFADRALSLAVAAGLLGVAPLSTATPVVALLALAVLLGAPVFVVLGGVALWLFAGDDLPLAAIPLNHYQLTVNPSLPAIPLFTLAGYFLAEGGAPARLIRVFRALFGRFRGGAALVTVLLTAFFTSFTGASGVTILALGGLLMPLLQGVRYPERAGIGLITSGCSLGVLIPPALPLILYAIIARQPIETMLLAAVVPAAVMTTMLVLLGIWRQPKDTAPTPFDAAEALAALTALYAFIVEVLIYRDLSLTRDVPRVMAECGLLVGGIILILGMALGFTNYLIDAQIADQVSEWVQASIASPWVFLLALNGLLLLVGAFMDIYSAIIVVTPLIVPIGLAFGIHPVHLGVIFLANMELGFLPPPVGMNLFFASYRFGKPIGEVARAVLPALAVLAIGVLLITYVPAFSMWLPGVLLR